MMVGMCERTSGLELEDLAAAVLAEVKVNIRCIIPPALGS
jgi:hypothetical protein